jgi:hypothetical protein
MATEALAIGSNPETILFSTITDPSNIDAIHETLSCMVEFPTHHLLCSRGRANCLY